MDFKRRRLILPVLLVAIALCDATFHHHAGALTHELPSAAQQAAQRVATPHASRHRPASAPAVLDVGPEATTNAIYLGIGQRLRIHLPASPATGYGWQLEDGPPPFLLLESDPGQGPTTVLRPGSATASTWTFRAQQPGRANLRYAYRRQWETSSTPPVRVAVFDIAVE